MKSENHSSMGQWGCLFGMQLGSMPVLESGNSSWLRVITSLAMTIWQCFQDQVWLLFCWAGIIQLESFIYHQDMRANNPPYGYLATLIAVVVHSYQSWIGLSIFSLPWEFGWHFLVLWKLVLRGKAFRSDPAQFLWVLHLRWSPVILEIDLTFSFWEATRSNGNIHNCLESLLDFCDQYYKMEFLNTLLLEFLFANLCL